MLTAEMHEVYKNIAISIIVEAQRDTHRAHVWLTQSKRPSVRRDDCSGTRLLRGCETFVMSEWFDTLLGIACTEMGEMSTQEKRRMFKRWQLNGYAKKYPNKKKRAKKAGDNASTL